MQIKYILPVTFAAVALAAPSQELQDRSISDCLSVKKYVDQTVVDVKQILADVQKITDALTTNKGNTVITPIFEAVVDQIKAINDMLFTNNVIACVGGDLFNQLESALSKLISSILGLGGSLVAYHAAGNDLTPFAGPIEQLANSTTALYGGVQAANGFDWPTLVRTIFQIVQTIFETIMKLLGKSSS